MTLLRRRAMSTPSSSKTVEWRPSADANISGAPHSAAQAPATSLRARSLTSEQTASFDPKALFEVVIRTPTETVATAGDCLIVIVGRTLSANGVLAIHQGLERLHAAYGAFGYLSFIEAAQVGAMEPAARKLMADVISKYTQHITCAAFVVAGGGFRATAVRSILTAIHVASRAAHPLRAFATLQNALDWYAEKHPDRKRDTADLARALTELRMRPA